MKKGFRILKFKKDAPIFEVKDLSKSFDARPVLKLSIKFILVSVGILDQMGVVNYLFSMCIGELAPDNGKIFLNNKPIHDIPIHLRAKQGLGYLLSKEVYSICLFMTTSWE